MTTTRRVSQPSPAVRGGLLFPDGPTKRDRRPLAFIALIALGAGLYFLNARRSPAPPPVAILATRPAAATAPAAPRTGSDPVPTTWEELTAARAAAAARAQPAAPVVPEAEPEAEPAAAPAPRTRRVPERRQPERRRETLPPPPASEPAPVAAAPVSEPAAPGRLTVSSSPWGQLIVDGRVYGNTPRLNLPIAVGPRRLRIARDGFEPFDTTITVQPGEAIRLTGITLRAQP